jgi:dipeptidyl aminopeptidase/acylaminoacyl peptidase
MLRTHFKDAYINFTSETLDLSLAVARVSAPRIPPVFYLVDVKKQKVLQMLPAFPDLKPEDLAPTDPIEVVVRDKMKIRGYLTTPKGSTMKNLPMIVLVHGGPHGPYDRYDFDPEAQLFASRGFAVLQVNFRGSGGRGRDFENAGFGKWGREMEDDITDVVKWAIAYGVADRERIGIYGGSYGGYAALTGVFREPDLFQCAIGFAGVYDLPLMFEKGDIRELDRDVQYLQAAVGTDTEELRRRSPVYNADKIKVPVMLIHGRLDERVPFEHALRMRAALEKVGNPPVWISESGEEHGLGAEPNRVENYEKMLAFFARHLGPAASTSSAPN